MAFAHFIFVDFENVPELDLSAIAARAVRVSLLLGKNQKKLSTSLTLQIHRHAEQIELIEVGATGRNALDLVLASYLGRAIERNPAAEFAIVSKDKDFVAMIAHLTATGVKIAQYDAFAALPFLPAQKVSATAKTVATAKTREEKTGASEKDPDRSAYETDRASEGSNKL